MDNKNILRKLEEDPDLTKSLEAAWVAGAKPEEVLKLLSGSGIEVAAEDIEEAIQALQAAKAEKLGFQDLDNDELAHLAGGYCDSYELCLSSHYCDKSSTTCSGNSSCSSHDTCTYDFRCEHYY